MPLSRLLSYVVEEEETDPPEDDDDAENGFVLFAATAAGVGRGLGLSSFFPVASIVSSVGDECRYSDVMRCKMQHPPNTPFVRSKITDLFMVRCGSDRIGSISQ